MEAIVGALLASIQLPRPNIPGPVSLNPRSSSLEK